MLSVSKVNKILFLKFRKPLEKAEKSYFFVYNYYKKGCKIYGFYKS